MGTRALCPGEMRPQGTGVLLVQPGQTGRGGAGGRQGRLPEAQDKDSLRVKHPPRTDETLLRPEVFGQTELEKTKSRESSVRKGTQSKGNRPGGKGHQR